MRVLAITGMTLAGKSELIRYAATKFSLPFYTMGEVVKEEVKARGLLEESTRGVADEMRVKYGPQIWAERTLEKIQKDNPPVCLIDGLRSAVELNHFKEKLGGDFYLISICSDAKARDERRITRARPDDHEELASRDHRELGWGVGKVMELADYKITNESSLEAFKNKVDELFSKLLGP